MKRIALIVMTIIFNCTCIYSQEPLLLKKPLWKSKVSLISDSTIVIGAIFELKDSSILMSNTTFKDEYQIGNYSVQEIYIPQIKMIRTKKKIGFLHGMIAGGSAGLIIGGFLAIGAEDDPPCPQELTFGNLLCELTWKTAEDKIPARVIFPTAIGIGLGALLGSMSITIPINGSIHQYNYKKKELSKSTLKY